MRTVHKYEVKLGTVYVGTNPKVLSVKKQNGVKCVWVEVDVGSEADIELNILCIGTGHEYDLEKYKHVQTDHEPPFVWHWYWRVVS